MSKMFLNSSGVAYTHNNDDQIVTRLQTAYVDVFDLGSLPKLPEKIFFPLDHDGKALPDAGKTNQFAQDAPNSQPLSAVPAITPSFHSLMSSQTLMATSSHVCKQVGDTLDLEDIKNHPEAVQTWVKWRENVQKNYAYEPQAQPVQKVQRAETGKQLDYTGMVLNFDSANGRPPAGQNPSDFFNFETISSRPASPTVRSAVPRTVNKVSSGLPTVPPGYESNYHSFTPWLPINVPANPQNEILLLHPGLQTGVTIANAKRFGIERITEVVSPDLNSTGTHLCFSQGTPFPIHPDVFSGALTDGHVDMEPLWKKGHKWALEEIKRGGDKKGQNGQNDQSQPGQQNQRSISKLQEGFFLLNSIDLLHYPKFHTLLHFWLTLFTKGYPHYSYNSSCTPGGSMKTKETVFGGPTFGYHFSVLLCMNIAAIKLIGWVEPEKRPKAITRHFWKDGDKEWDESDEQNNGQNDQNDQNNDQNGKSTQSSLSPSSSPQSPNFVPSLTPPEVRLSSLYSVDVKDSKTQERYQAIFSSLLRRLMPLIPFSSITPLNYSSIMPTYDGALYYRVQDLTTVVIQIPETKSIIFPERIINSMVGYTHVVPPLARKQTKNTVMLAAADKAAYLQSIGGNFTITSNPLTAKIQPNIFASWRFVDVVHQTSLKRYFNNNTLMAFDTWCYLYFSFAPLFYSEMAQYQVKWYTKQLLASKNPLHRTPTPGQQDDQNNQNVNLEQEQQDQEQEQDQDQEEWQPNLSVDMSYVHLVEISTWPSAFNLIHDSFLHVFRSFCEQNEAYLEMMEVRRQELERAKRLEKLHELKAQAKRNLEESVKQHANRHDPKNAKNAKKGQNKDPVPIPQPTSTSPPPQSPDPVLTSEEAEEKLAQWARQKTIEEEEKKQELQMLAFRARNGSIFETWKKSSNASIDTMTLPAMAETFVGELRRGKMAYVAAFANQKRAKEFEQKEEEELILPESESEKSQKSPESPLGFYSDSPSKKALLTPPPGFIVQFYTFGDIITLLEHSDRWFADTTAHFSPSNFETAQTQLYLGSKPTREVSWPAFLSGLVEGGLDDFFTLTYGQTLENPDYVDPAQNRAPQRQNSEEEDDDQNYQNSYSPQEDPSLNDPATLLELYGVDIDTESKFIELIPPSAKWFDEDGGDGAVIEPHAARCSLYPTSDRHYIICFDRTTRRIETLMLAILHRADGSLLERLFVCLNEEELNLLANLDHLILHNFKQITTISNLTVTTCLDISSVDLYAPEFYRLITEAIKERKDYGLRWNCDSTLNRIPVSPNFPSTTVATATTSAEFSPDIDQTDTSHTQDSSTLLDGTNSVSVNQLHHILIKELISNPNTPSRLYQTLLRSLTTLHEDEQNNQGLSAQNVKFIGPASFSPLDNDTPNLPLEQLFEPTHPVSGPASVPTPTPTLIPNLQFLRDLLHEELISVPFLDANVKCKARSDGEVPETPPPCPSQMARIRTLVNLVKLIEFYKSENFVAESQTSTQTPTQGQTPTQTKTQNSTYSPPLTHFDVLIDRFPEDYPLSVNPTNPCSPLTPQEVHPLAYSQPIYLRAPAKQGSKKAKFVSSITTVNTADRDSGSSKKDKKKCAIM